MIRSRKGLMHTTGLCEKAVGIFFSSIRFPLSAEQTMFKVFQIYTYIHTYIYIYIKYLKNKLLPCHKQSGKQTP